jgi:hypothetical protein
MAVMMQNKIGHVPGDILESWVTLPCVKVTVPETVKCDGHMQTYVLI